MTQGQALRFLRKAHGYSLAQAADYAYLEHSATYLQQIEMGYSTAEREELHLLVELYGVRISSVLKFPVAPLNKSETSHLEAMTWAVEEIKKYGETL